jgi:hypothetical protein
MKKKKLLTATALITMGVLVAISAAMVHLWRRHNLERVRANKLEAMPRKSASVPHFFQIVLSSFDPDVKHLSAKVTSHVSVGVLFSCAFPKIRQAVLMGPYAPAPIGAQCYFAHPVVTDGTTFDPDSDTIKTFFFYREVIGVPFTDPKYYEPDKPSPEPITDELGVIGDPGLYPFDSYLVMIRIDGPGFIVDEDRESEQNSADAAEFLGIAPEKLYKQLAPFSGDQSRIKFEVPGFVYSSLDGNGLKSRGVPWSPFQREKDGQRPAFIFLEMRRALLLRVTTIIVGFLAVAYALIVGCFTTPEEYLKTIAASFLSFWALRSVLTGSAPKVPTIIDYATMALFALPIGMILFRYLRSRWRVRNAGKVSNVESQDG